MTKMKHGAIILWRGRCDNCLLLSCTKKRIALVIVLDMLLRFLLSSPHTQCPCCFCCFRASSCESDTESKIEVRHTPHAPGEREENDGQNQ